MPRRPASDPLSYHKHTRQYYVTRAYRRIYLGTDKRQAMQRYYQLAAGFAPNTPPVPDGTITCKELANRFLAAQQANWQARETTLRCYRDWLGHFLKDHSRMLAANLTVEIFAAWKLKLKDRGYAPQSINHYLNAVRSLYAFGVDTDLLVRAPRLRRIRNEPLAQVRAAAKPLYSVDALSRLLAAAMPQMRAMILLGLNCGFGPKDNHDLTWDDILDERVTLPRSKTGVSQTYLLWSESRAALAVVKRERQALLARLKRRGRKRSDQGHVFVTKYWRPWNRDAVAGEFRKLCEQAGLPCYGFYRLRHCASTALSSVAMPHVHRKFLRHRRLQQQVTYTHVPDAELDEATMKARMKLLGLAIPVPGRSRPAEPAEGAADGRLRVVPSDEQETHRPRWA